MYAGSGEGLFLEVDDLIMYLIVTCDNKTSIRAAQCMLHRKGLHSTVAFVLEVRGVNVITSI